MRRARWLALLSFILFLSVGVAAGSLYARARRAQELIRTYLETTLSRELQLPVRVGRLGLSPRLGWVEADRAAVLDPETRIPLLQVERLQMGFEVWPLLRRELRIRSVRLRELRLTLDDSPRLRAIALNLLGRLRTVGGDRTRIPVEITGGAFRYRDRVFGVAVDAEGVELSWGEGEGGKPASSEHPWFLANWLARP